MRRYQKEMADRIDAKGPGGQALVIKYLLIGVDEVSFIKKSLEGRFPYFTPIYWMLCNSIRAKVLETRQGIVSLSFDILSKVGDAFCHQK